MANASVAAASRPGHRDRRLCGSRGCRFKSCRPDTVVPTRTTSPSDQGYPPRSEGSCRSGQGSSSRSSWWAGGTSVSFACLTAAPARAPRHGPRPRPCAVAIAERREQLVSQGGSQGPRSARGRELEPRSAGARGVDLRGGLGYARRPFKRWGDAMPWVGAQPRLCAAAVMTGSRDTSVCRLAIVGAGAPKVRRETDELSHPQRRCAPEPPRRGPPSPWALSLS